MNKRDKKLVIIFGIIAFVLFVICLKEDAIVNRKGYVESVENSIVTIIDTTGNVWEWEEEEGECFNKGDAVKVRMNNNHTINTIEDDIIVKIVIDKMYK